MRIGSVQPGLVVAMLVATLALGCAPIQPAPPAEPVVNPSLDALKAEVALLNGELASLQTALAGEIGRASCRERV